MGNKLKQIHLANILLEQRYLREQAQTGTTQSSSTPTPPTTGATQTPPTTGTKTSVSIPPIGEKPIISLDEIKNTPEEEIPSKIPMCGTNGDKAVAKIGNLIIHNIKNDINFCIG